mgnify:CR=1 FL=1
MTELVLVRHGESTANRDNTYTGWSDVPLTAVGIAQAHQAITSYGTAVWRCAYLSPKTGYRYREYYVK